MTPIYARHKRTTLAIATAVAAGALLTTGLTTGASAESEPAGAKAKAAAVPVTLSPATRTALIKEAAAEAPATADEIGLGAKEKLVVRDVIKDADGTLHTRYERTYAGLPVLGGDLVVHEDAAGETTGVTKAQKAAIKVTDLTPEVTTAAVEKQAVTLAKKAGSTKSEASDAPRKVIWAARAPRPSPTRPSSAASRRTAPRTSCTSSRTRPPAPSCTSTRASRTAPARACTRAPSP